MIRKVLLYLLILFPALNTYSQLQVGDWKLYSVFSGRNVQKIIDTDNIVYYLSDGYLFSYDKDNDESFQYNKRNDMSDVDVADIYYNYDKNYLFVVYSNSNIDLLYDEGNVINVPDLKNTVLNTSKAINSVDFQGDEIYVATDFGYMVVDDKNYSIKESFNYGKSIKSIISTDKYLYASFDNYIYVSPKNENHFNISSFVRTSRNMNVKLIKLSNGKMITGSGALYVISIGDEGVLTNPPATLIKNATISQVSESTDGFIVSFASSYMRISNEGVLAEEVALPSEVLQNGLVSSMESDGSVWGIDKNGIKQFRREDNGTFTYMHENFRPNASSANHPFYLEYTNDRLYVMNSGPNNWVTNQFVDFGLSLMENGQWNDLAPDNLSGLVNSSGGRLTSLCGLAIDPVDNDAVWFGTRWEGVFCLKNNQQIQKFDNTNSPLRLDYICEVPDLAFDSKMNLWCINDNDLNPSDVQLFALPAEKRFSEVQKSDFVTFFGNNLENNVNSKLYITSDDIVLFANNSYKTSLLALDYNGTLDNKSDDRQAVIGAFVDQDGSTFDIGYIYDFLEDSDGKIWLATNAGVGYINNIENMFTGNIVVNRVKVPRNDGTNLADYLLQGISVSSIAMDGAGRKWFGTTTSGIYLVSADGTEILEHFTTENSYLPSNLVFSVECNTDNNSVYITTDKGLAEYSSDAVTPEQNFDNVYAYPNPVRPDYTGYITIRGLMENSLVKIADTAGNVVFSTKSNGGMAVWDGCNSNGKRVDTGVYFVFASQSEDGSSEGCVTKILIVR